MILNAATRSHYDNFRLACLISHQIIHVEIMTPLIT